MQPFSASKMQACSYNAASTCRCSLFIHVHACRGSDTEALLRQLQDAGPLPRLYIMLHHIDGPGADPLARLASPPSVQLENLLVIVLVS